MNGYALAIDIGGTKMSGAWVDRQGAVLAHQAVLTPREVPWEALRELITTLLARAPGDMIGVGVGTAGPLDHELGTVSPVNIPAWRDFPLQNHIQRLLPGTRIELIGDGICAAIGEHWLGAGRGSRHMLGVVVSTGVGGGTILDGRVHLGRTANAGHVGHLVVDVNGELCPCGSVGCVETVASGPSLTRWARAQGWAAPTTASARELADAARQGDAVAVAAFDRAARGLAAGFVSAAAVCDLDLVVVGGGVAAAGQVLFGPLRHWTKRFAGLTFLRPLTVVPATLKEHAGLLGAAALVQRPEAYSGRPALGNRRVMARPS